MFWVALTAASLAGLDVLGWPDLTAEGMPWTVPSGEMASEGSSVCGSSLARLGGLGFAR
jgi:hypothetical protein